MEDVTGDVFYQVRERLLSADLLVLMVQGLDDNEIDSRLVLRPGTTAQKADEVVRRPGINRMLLQISAETLQENLIAVLCDLSFRLLCGIDAVNGLTLEVLREPPNNGLNLVRSIGTFS